MVHDIGVLSTRAAQFTLNYTIYIHTYICKNNKFRLLLLYTTIDNLEFLFFSQMLELDVIGDRLIGSDEDGGLSLEQRKRTTLGVELAANPSLIFLGADSARRCR